MPDSADDFDVNSALVEAVKALGGSKVVGPALWPDLPIINAQRRLLDALNPERANHLSPEQVVWLMRRARWAGHDALMQALCAELHYKPPVPMVPSDEAAELQGQMATLLSMAQTLATKIERLTALPGARP